MRRTIAVLLLVAVVAALVAAPATAAPPIKADHLRGFSITPPGQDGNVTADEFAAGDFGPHYTDQLEMYAALVDDDDVTEAELEVYLHPMQFAPVSPEDPYEPREGVEVYRDDFGVPHIYGNTIEDATFGMGYVTAEDRLWQMDVFRHAARGTLAAFVGPGEEDAFLQMDIDTRREGYTEEEITAMFDSFDDKFGEVGVQVQEGLQAYTDGVNAYIEEAAFSPFTRPFEYEATGNPAPEHPAPWTVQDTLFLVVLQLRVFGETAGGELQNAGFLDHLQERLGRKKGTAAFHDIMFQNDPNSPTSIDPSDANFRTQRLGRLKAKSVAIPDNSDALAERQALRERSRNSILASMGFTKPASNALIVSAERSETGNPLLLGGPQVGHSVPSFFLDLSVHAPGVDFRGPAVPGASALIPLGRGVDYAWTLTTGYSDAVDVRAELLCEPDGGDPTLESNGYMFRGKCLEMESRVETFESKPPPTDPGPPASEEHTFYRTQHGPVFQRTLVDGKPAALVKERFFWMKELDSIPAFYEWNTQIDDIDDFAAAARDFTMSFNAFYADSEQIGYFHVGHYPVRKKGTSPMLPTWGTGKWEWQGRRAYSQQPKIIDPDTGWIANWNNKPAQGWKNYDSVKWGSIQRVRLLQDDVGELLNEDGTLVLSDLLEVVGNAATRDARGVYLGPAMLRKAARKVPEEDAELYQQALGLVQGWIDRGGHRTNLDRDDTMDDGAALAIFDAWYDKLVHGIFDDELGEDGYEALGVPIADHSPTDGGGFWFDFSSYLSNLFHKDTRKARFSMNYCNNFETNKRETCADQVGSALVAALAELKEAQGDDPNAWTTPAENIAFSEQGAGSVSEIPWQNRGSENHLVEILEDAG
ncbi:MAG: penicillin acylase family protein [Actinomycetota bacterium]